MSNPRVSRTVRETTKPQMWIGTVKDLESLVEAAVHLTDRSRSDLIAALNESEPRRKAEWLTTAYISAGEKADDKWRIEEAKHRDDLLERLRLTMTVTLNTYGEELKGDPAGLIAELDKPSDVASVRLVLGSEQGLFRMPPHSGFRLNLDKYGVTTHIFGVSRDWSDVARGRLSDALFKQRPRYARVRSPLLTAVFATLPFAVASSLLAGLYSEGFRHQVVLAVLTDMTGIAFGLVAAFVFWPRLFPMFELLPAGKTARGRVTMSLAGSAALWIVGTILVPLWLR